MITADLGGRSALVTGGASGIGSGSWWREPRSGERESRRTSPRRCCSCARERRTSPARPSWSTEGGGNAAAGGRASRPPAPALGVRAARRRCRSSIQGRPRNRERPAPDPGTPSCCIVAGGYRPGANRGSAGEAPPGKGGGVKRRPPGRSGAARGSFLYALGLFATDLRYDLARTRVQRAPDYDLDEIARTMQTLEEEAAARRAELRAAPTGTFHRGGWFDGPAPDQAPEQPPDQAAD